MEQIHFSKFVSTTHIHKEVRWCALDVGTVKLSVNVALLQHLAALVVVIARDNNGQLLAS